MLEKRTKNYKCIEDLSLHSRINEEICWLWHDCRADDLRRRLCAAEQTTNIASNEYDGT